MNNAGASKNGMQAGLGLRLRAAEELKKVLGGESFHPLLAKDMAAPRDRALVNRLVTGALRRHGHLNQIISTLLTRGIPARSGNFEAILRLGLTQLLFMPEQAAHAALHLSVEALRRDRRGGRFDRLLNATLRQAQREEQKWRELDRSLLFPDWLRKNWEGQYGAKALSLFGDALLLGAPLDITLGDDDPALVAALGGERLIANTVRVRLRDRPVAELALYREGRWWVQDVAAAIPARLFNLGAGARVLDMCAAPGGKSAQLIRSGYEVSALDISDKRLQRVGENLSRLKMSAELIAGDATQFRAVEKFDGILLDAPCSATGTFRRHPETIWQRSASDIEGRVKLQRKMIVNAIENLKPGGQLIFCTCSLQAEEGEAQANWISNSFPHMKKSPLGTRDMEKSGLEKLENSVDRQGYLRTHPALEWRNGDANTSTVLGMDGFFAARFIREPT